MKVSRILFPLLIVLLFTGCPFESEYIFGEIQPVDSNLLYIWEGKLNFEGEDWTLDITDFNDEEYLINLEIKRPQKTDHHQIRGLVTKFRSENIFHFQFLAGPKEYRTYNYFKYELKGDELLMRFLQNNDTTIKLISKNELYNYFHRNIDNEEAWSKVLKFER